MENLNTLLVSGALVALLGVITMSLVQVSQALLGLRSRTLRKGLATVFYEARKGQVKENYELAKLRLYCKKDAQRVVDFCGPVPGRGSVSRLFRSLFGPGTTWIEYETLFHVITKEFPDLETKAGAAVRHFHRLRLSMSRQFRRSIRVLTVFWAIVVTLVYLRLPGTPEGFAYGGQVLADAGLTAIAAILIALTASLGFTVLKTHASLGDASTVTEPEFDRFQAKVAQERITIGRDGCAVRAINFAGGGFDSIMQLGVIHALLVIQGRPPDVVVGISTGSVSAAALAEVLQAGEDEEAGYADTPWENLDAERQLELQDKRMKARVKRFREFENACHLAREQLLDALVPDAYQIDSTDPLAPLRTPFFPKEERRQKLDSLGTKSGIIRLYNDLLGLHIPLGTLVRLVRRILGLKAASDVRSRFWRNVIRFQELFHIWLLMGNDLLRASRLLQVLARPFWPGVSRVRPASAGSLIFRLEIYRRFRKFTLTGLFVILALSLWIGGSLLPFWLVEQIIDLGKFANLIAMPSGVTFNLLVAMVIYFLFILLALAATRRFDTDSIMEAMKNTLRAVIQFIFLVVKWLVYLSILPIALSIVLSVMFSIMKWAVDLAVGMSVSEFATVYVPINPWPIIKYAVQFGATLFLILLALALISWIYARLSAVFKHAREPFSFGRWYLNKLLKSYQLDKSLFHPYELRKFLLQVFDPDYYGRADLGNIVDDSLKDRLESPAPATGRKKQVADYRRGHHRTPIHVGIAAANALSGELETLPEEQSVVDALVTAMAVIPFFPSQEIHGRLYVDGSNVANVPTRALIGMLQHRINPESGTVQIYSVSPLPFSSSTLPDEEQSSGKYGTEPYVNLWDVTKRALLLQKHRDAHLERQLTEFYTQVIPEQDQQQRLQNQVTIAQAGGTANFVRAWVTPVELSEPASLNKRILLASKAKQRDAVAEIIADGCRAALEMMIRPSIVKAAHGRRHVKCSNAVREHLKRQKDIANLKGGLVDYELPGSDPRFGPGLHEICERCALNRTRDTETAQESKKTKKEKRHVLRHRRKAPDRPEWPHERSRIDKKLKDTAETKRRVEKKLAAYREKYKRIENWPEPRNGPSDSKGQNGSDRPTVSMLFSGGVFRGVFQMGVLNALNELKVQPDLIAGASIGSITAAMVARVFSMEKDLTDEQLKRPIPRPQRHRQIARLAATYLAVDRLLLTDRFADFIRNLTIRASDIRFSIRQTDHFFRKYDYPVALQFEKTARQVMAGLERLFYLNPYQLNALVRAIKNEEREKVITLLRTYTQQWLVRMKVGLEVLGAEPLETLIKHFVVPGEYSKTPASAPMSAFSNHAVQFLATATNLTAGKLEIIGEPHSNPKELELLMEGLLASSAFPAVFRPRWSQDLKPQSISKAQFIDGGVMDNLPIEPVINFLAGAEAADKIASRPCNADGQPMPHMIFAASLEVDTPQLLYRDQWTPLKNHWPSLRKRTKELNYNTKLEIYQKAERNLRAIYEHCLHGAEDSKDTGALMKPLDIEIVMVKPKWLCETFGFHPMLGFRREKQARSIAHGCAATLIEFANLNPDHLTAWGIDTEQLPTAKTFSEAESAWWKKRYLMKDACWLRPDKPCPFSKSRLQLLNRELSKSGDAATLDSEMIDEISLIHKFCKQSKTHRAE